MADTKTALLDVAETAVRRSGFDGFSYADLASAVGIRKASVHYHFPKKADLGVALTKRYHGAMQAELARIDTAFATAAGRLSGIVDHYRNALKSGTQLCLCVALSVAPPALSPHVIAELQTYRRTMLVWLQDVFDQAVADGTIRNVTNQLTEAHSCLAQLEGAHLAARVAGNAKTFDQALRLLTERCVFDSKLHNPRS